MADLAPDVMDIPAECWTAVMVFLDCDWNQVIAGDKLIRLGVRTEAVLAAMVIHQVKPHRYRRVTAQVRLIVSTVMEAQKQ